MAKDPAMLWYWGDWNSGTVLMTRFLKGCYMDLLHAQFNSGRLSLEEIRMVLGSDFGQAWPTLQKKFAVDKAGKYFNERLELEKNKRMAFTASRKKNLESPHKDGDMKPHIDAHMENANRDVNIIGIDLKKESKKDFDEPDTPGDEIFFPVDTPAMRRLWAAWKEARWKNHKLTYAMYGEQAALKQLEGLNFHQARSAIQQAIASNWRNLYPEQNGQGKSTNDSKSRIDEIVQNRHGSG
jgi:hypothetical protein